MTEAAETEEMETTAEEETPLPDTVWDEYDGQHVVLQLNRPYIAVTSPGVPAQVPMEGGGTQFLQIPLMAGIFRVKKDQRGGVRITMLMNDPNERKSTKVRADLNPDLIDLVTITQEASNIVQP